MIKQENAYSVTALAIGGLMLDFMLLENESVIYPRDRIMHIIISALLTIAVVKIINILNVDKLKYLIVIFAFLRLFDVCRRYIDYYNSFHGSNTFAIIIFTIAIGMFFWRFIYDKARDIYSFYIVINILVIILIIMLSCKHINVSNLYVNDLNVNLKINKLFIYFDIIPIYFLIDDKKLREKFSKIYVISGTILVIVFILLQGLCVEGNVLYKISPLQSLIQIFSTTTILRFDYIFTMWSVFIYFGIIMLYVWMLKKLQAGNV